MHEGDIHSEYHAQGDKSLPVYTSDQIKQMSSIDLINLLSDLGHGTRYRPGNDTRTAGIHETGRFTYSGHSYAKIVVQYDPPGTLWDYGVRLIIQDPVETKQVYNS
jgi:hypothetical protein